MISCKYLFVPNFCNFSIKKKEKQEGNTKEKERNKLYKIKIITRNLYKLKPFVQQVTSMNSCQKCKKCIYSFISYISFHIFFFLVYSILFYSLVLYS